MPEKKPKFERVVCKPCWELNYCPFGPLVEHFPLGPTDTPLSEVKARYQALLGEFAAGAFKTEDEILEAIDRLQFHYPSRWQQLQDYDTSGMECNVFGHICPVFFTFEHATETREIRRSGRAVPRHVMLAVVRRDGQICQICYRNVPDRELHFDHIIPVSEGGPTTVANLRVACDACNLARGNSTEDFLAS